MLLHCRISVDISDRIQSSQTFKLFFLRCYSKAVDKQAVLFDTRLPVLQRISSFLMDKSRDYA